ncbi:MAG: DNA polymerase V [Candidatus Endobugula sp.]|jgi:DNA polymerase V
MIALCDMNSFYCSVELIFRPDITNRRVVVLSNNDGCIVACTPEATAAGAKKFGPYFQQKKLLEQNKVTVFSSNYTLYGLVSQRIMQLLADEAPLLEVYSIDEAFLDVTGIPNIKNFAAHLNQRVWQEQRIPMGVGVAPTKVLAKLANRASKILPKLKGVCVLDEPNKWEWLAARLPVSDVWGIGKGLSLRLAEIKVVTALDLTRLPPAQARHIGGVVLERIVSELNGTPCLYLETDVKAKKEIVSSRSFGKKVDTLAEINSAISNFATRGTQKLRGQDCVTGCLSVWIQTSAHDSRTEQYAHSAQWLFDPPIDDPRTIAATAVNLASRIFTPGYRYAKAGISLSKIRPRSTQQSDLFHQPECDPRIADTMDLINKRFGRHTVRPACQLDESWQMKRQFLSPNYYTQWSDIPIVKC